MANFDPDEFLKEPAKSNSESGAFDPDKFIQGVQPQNQPDPGYLPAAGRAARGLATGVESTIDRIGGSLPWSYDPKLTKKVLAERPPPADRLESGARSVGEVLPTFAVPGFSPARAAYSGIPLVSRGLQTLAAGALTGGLGGAMLPEGNPGKNIATGAATGMATGALGTAYNALPWNVRNLINITAAGYAANSLRHLGIDQWWIHAPVFWGLYRQRLADLVAEWSNRLGAGAGASAAQGRRLYQGETNDQR